MPARNVLPRIGVYGPDCSSPPRTSRLQPLARGHRRVAHRGGCRTRHHSRRLRPALGRPPRRFAGHGHHRPRQRQGPKTGGFRYALPLVQGTQVALARHRPRPARPEHRVRRHLVFRFAARPARSLAAPPPAGTRPCAHAINVIPDTQLAKLYGEGEVVVNSEPSPGRAARGARVSASAPTPWTASSRRSRL